MLLKQLIFGFVLFGVVACQGQQVRSTDAASDKVETKTEQAPASTAEQAPAQDAVPTAAEANGEGRQFLDDVATFAKAMDNTPRFSIVDVRTAQEYNGGALPNAGNMDFYAPNFKEQLNEMPKDFPLFLYCHSGRRSAAAAKMAIEMGFTEVHDLAGGYAAWKAAGR